MLRALLLFISLWQLLGQSSKPSHQNTQIACCCIIFTGKIRKGRSPWYSVICKVFTLLTLIIISNALRCLAWQISSKNNKNTLPIPFPMGKLLGAFKFHVITNWTIWSTLNYFIHWRESRFYWWRSFLSPAACDNHNAPWAKEFSPLMTQLMILLHFKIKYI